MTFCELGVVLGVLRGGFGWGEWVGGLEVGARLSWEPIFLEVDGRWVLKFMKFLRKWLSS